MLIKMILNLLHYNLHLHQIFQKIMDFQQEILQIYAVTGISKSRIQFGALYEDPYKGKISTLEKDKPIVTTEIKEPQSSPRVKRQDLNPIDRKIRFGEGYLKERKPKIKIPSRHSAASSFESESPSSPRT